jgi:hypothetical protein
MKRRTRPDADFISASGRSGKCGDCSVTDAMEAYDVARDSFSGG